MGRTLLRSPNVSAEQLAIFVAAWGQVVAQRRERLAADQELLDQLRQRAGLPALLHARARTW